MKRAPTCYNPAAMPNVPMENTVTVNGEDAGNDPQSAPKIHDWDKVKAAALSLFAVVCYSLMPLSVVLSGSKEFPFLFNMGWRAGIAIGYALILAVFFRELFFNRAIWGEILGKNLFLGKATKGQRRFPVTDLLLVMVAYFSISLFAMSIRYLDITAAIMMAAISPVVMVFIDKLKLFGRDSSEGGEVNKDKEDLHWSRLSFIFLGLIGAAFIVFGQLAIADREPGSSPEDSTMWLLALGILLALGSAVIYGLNRRSNTWGNDAENKLPENIKDTIKDKDDNYDQRRVRLFFATIAGLIASLAVVPLFLVLGLDSGENAGALLTTVSGLDVPISDILPVGSLLFLIVAVGGLTYVPAGMAWRRAQVYASKAGEDETEEKRATETRNAIAGLNALEQLRPVLSLLWFIPFTFLAAQPDQAQAGLAAIGIHIQVDYLIIGVIFIVIGNLLLNFDTERTRWGFKALMMALGACGTFVYFRAEFFEKYIGDKFWITEHYFESVGLAATVFTLLLAFRVANLVTRSHSEESQAFELFRKLEMFVKRDILDPRILDCVIKIDAPENRAALESAYQEARDYFANAPQVDDVEERLALAEAEGALDAMARSKQLGLVFGELFALIIFAALTVFFALLSRPEGSSPFSRFLIDLFAMLISSVTIFLLTNVWDLQRERGSEQLSKQNGQVPEARPGYVVLFHESRVGPLDRWLSILFGTAIVLTYGGLLGHRYLGWFS